MTQRPGDIVNQDVFPAEENGWTQNAIGNLQAVKSGFQFSFSPKVWQIRCDIRISDAHMNNPSNAGVSGRRKQNFRICDSLPVRKQPVIEPHPVCFDERVNSSQGNAQYVGFFKMKRKSFYFLAERIWAVD